jgi:tetratricopeptide (TPR) repeat protein
VSVPSRAPVSHRSVAVIVAVLCAAGPVRAQKPDPLGGLTTAVAAAESALQLGERQIAESHLRAALYEGWMLLGAIAATEGRLADARTAFTHASTAVANNRAADEALAAVQTQMGDAAAALPILSRLSGLDPKNMRVRHLLAQAYVVSGHPEAAVQELEEAHSTAPDDLETTFTLASGYARLKKMEEAERLFAEVAKARPIPQTHVLIGRAYRDAGAYDRATPALRRALAMDPRVRRAHYYLGMVALLSEGVSRIDEAIGEFQQEQKIAPDDPLNTLRLGMALVVARREREALVPLEALARAPNPTPEAVEYLGRAQLGAGRAADAVVTLQRALKMLPDRRRRPPPAPPPPAGWGSSSMCWRTHSARRVAAPTPRRHSSRRSVSPPRGRRRTAKASSAFSPIPATARRTAARCRSKRRSSRARPPPSGPR